MPVRRCYLDSLAVLRHRTGGSRQHLG